VKLFAQTPPGGRAGRRLVRTATAVLLAGVLVAAPNAAYAGDDNAAGSAGQASDRGSSIQISQTLGCLIPNGQSTISVPGGVTARITASGRSTVVADYVPFVATTQAKFLSNSAQVKWWGKAPARATSVTLAEEWGIDFIAVSWGFSNAPSGTFSPGTGRIEWSTTIGNTDVIDHAWPEVRIHVNAGGINHMRFNVTGHFQFGSSFVRSITGFADHRNTMGIGIPDSWGNC
jgi:hypothetical protein